MCKTFALIFCLLLFAAPTHAVVVGFSGPPASGGGGCDTATDSAQFAFATSNSVIRECTDTSYYGEYFTLSSSIDSTGVSFHCVEGGVAGGNVTVYLYAYDTSADEPTGSALASCTVAYANLPQDGTPAEHFFEWSSYPTLTAGDYVVYGVGDGTSALGLYRLNSDTVSNAAYVSSTDSGVTWTETIGYDMRGEGVYGCSN